MATVDMLPTHTAMHIPAQLTTDLMSTVVSTSVMPRLSQRLKLMPTMLVPMVMVDFMATVDILPTHTAMDIPAQLTTDLTPTAVFISVSQRLMLTTGVTMDTHPTAHMAMELIRTDTPDMAARMDTDTTTKNSCSYFTSCKFA